MNSESPAVALAEALVAAMQVRRAAMEMNNEYGFAIFEDDDFRAMAASVLAVLESNGFTVSHLSAASERETP